MSLPGISTSLFWPSVLFVVDPTAQKLSQGSSWFLSAAFCVSLLKISFPQPVTFSLLSRHLVSFHFLLYDFSSKIQYCSEQFFAVLQHSSTGSNTSFVGMLFLAEFECQLLLLQLPNAQKVKYNVQDTGTCPQDSRAQSSGVPQGLKWLLWVRGAWSITCPLLPLNGAGAGNPLGWLTQMPQFALQWPVPLHFCFMHLLCSILIAAIKHHSTIIKDL